MILENNAPRYSPDLSEFRSDMMYVKNINTNEISPAIALSDIESIVCSMLEENILYVKKNGLTQSAKISRERLFKILEIIEPFNQISTINHELKINNNILLAENQSLKSKLKIIEHETNMANSI